MAASCQLHKKFACCSYCLCCKEILYEKHHRLSISLELWGARSLLSPKTLGFAAGQEDVRLAAVAVLKNTVHECLSGEVGSKHEGVFASLEAALGPTQQGIWVSVLSGEDTGP